MKDQLLVRFSLVLVTSLVVLMSCSSTFGATTVIIQSGDPAGVGFNDPTPVAPIGGNPGTTLGQQRRNAFQFAGNIWGAMLNSNSPITVRATWDSLACNSSTAVLGSAGASILYRGGPGIRDDTWYVAALANALAGADRSPGVYEISASFNVDLGKPGCGPGPFYLGFDNNHGNGTDLVTLLLHEFAHGLGIHSFVDAATGEFKLDNPSIYDRFLFDNVTGKSWGQAGMTSAERKASAISITELAWNGPTVTADVQSVLATPTLRVNSPAGIAGDLVVGTAAFGERLSSPGVTAAVVQANPVDGCSALLNGAAVSGKIALIDRGACNFVVKVKNAQNAGAVGVIIANDTSGVVLLTGSDNTITIPSVSISNTDASSIKAQLGTPVNATILANTAVRSGVDAAGRALLFAPNPLQVGVSVTHLDPSAFPNQLMEPGPNPSGELTHSVVPVWDLTFDILKDLGWLGNKLGDSQFFVRQHYVDFLNRNPDSSGLDFWNNQIVGCGLDQACIDLRRINVSAAFFLSIEFQETGYPVYRFYKSAYGNIPSAPVPVTFAEFLPDTQTIGQGIVVGVGNWQAQLESNKAAFALTFVARLRFFNAFPTSLTPAQFVDALFANSGVTPTSSERNDAILGFGSASNTADHTARARALRLVADHPQLKNQELNKAFVLMQYFGYLRRNPNDPPESGLNFDGYNFWLGKLNNHGGNFIEADMVKSFIVSSEYRQRFGQ